MIYNSMHSHKVMRGLFISLLLITIIPVQGEVLVDETLNISAAEIRYYEINISSSGTTLDISINVVSGNDITILVMDPTNYDNWISSNPAQAYLERTDRVSGDYSVTLDEGEYYVVFANDDSLTSVSVAIVIDMTTPSSGYGSIIIGVVVIIVIAVIYNNSQKNKRMVPQQPMQQQGLQCNNCNFVSPPGIKFCNSCGNQLF